MGGLFSRIAYLHLMIVCLHWIIIIQGDIVALCVEEGYRLVTWYGDSIKGKPLGLSSRTSSTKIRLQASSVLHPFG